MFTHVSNLIKSVAGVLALLPGIGILATNLETPPKIGDIYGGMVAILGFLIVIATQAFYPRIKRLSWASTVSLVFILMMAGFASVFWYKSTFDQLVRTYSYEENKGHFVDVVLVLPLKPEGELKEWLNSDEVGQDWSMMLALDRQRLEDLLAYQNTSAHATLMGIFLLLFSFLIGAMTIAAWRAAADLDPPE